MARCSICNELDDRFIDSDFNEHYITDVPIMDRSPLFAQEKREKKKVSVIKDKLTDDYICNECMLVVKQILREQEFYDDIKYTGQDALDHSVSLDELYAAEEALDPDSSYRIDNRPVRVQISEGGYWKRPKFED